MTKESRPVTGAFRETAATSTELVGAPGGETPLAQLDRLNVYRGEKQVLNSVSLTIYPGEVTAIIGPNGAGKSTVLGVLSGDITPSTGHVRLGDRHITEFKPRPLARYRAVMLQDSQLTFPYTVTEVTRMGMSAWNELDEAERHNRVESALGQHELKELSTRSVTELSGGEVARTSLARVQTQAARIYLLDEPTAQLDIRHQESTLQWCRSLAHGGDTAVVLVLHQIELTAAWADKMVLMDHGSVVAEGAPAEVCTAERLSAVYRWPMSVDFGDPRAPRIIPIRH